MAQYIILATSTVVPSDDALRALNPDISLPEIIDDATAALVGAAIVQPAAPPTAPGRYPVEGAPVETAGVWNQTWTLMPVATPTIDQAAQLTAIRALRVKKLANSGKTGGTLAALAMQAGFDPP
jgi:hypothetical protein